MAFIFSKTPETEGYFKDYESIDMTLDNNNASLDTVVDMFKRYLLACGYIQGSVNDYFEGEI